VHLKCLAFVVVLVPVALITACTPGAGFQVIEHNIVISEYAADEAQSVAAVSGVARNTGAWPLEGCGVTVIFYDYEGNKLDVSSSSCQKLGPGENWDFKVELKGRPAWRVARYSVSTFTR
jgi:hypothetical protein